LNVKPALEPAVILILQREAFHRAKTHSYKVLSRKTGLSIAQVSNAVGKLIRAQRKRIIVNQSEQHAGSNERNGA